MWLSITSPVSAFFMPATTVLPSRSVCRGNRAIACATAQEAAATEVPPQSVFAALDYDQDFVPWDIGEAQPPVRKAARDGAFGSAGTTVLDCGCGAGDNANWLAARGHDVLGFDLSPSAIATAREVSGYTDVRAAIAEHGGAVEFTQASAVDLGAAGRVQARAKELGGFAVVLDSALLHCLDDEAQRTYLGGLRPLVRPGGKLLLGCFSDANPEPWSRPGPRRMSEAQLRTLFSEARGWRVRDLWPTWYERPAGARTMAWWCTHRPREAARVREWPLTPWYSCLPNPNPNPNPNRHTFLLRSYQGMPFFQLFSFLL